jgi:hypothetical protein
MKVEQESKFRNRLVRFHCGENLLECSYRGFTEGKTYVVRNTEGVHDGGPGYLWVLNDNRILMRVRACHFILVR